MDTSHNSLLGFRVLGFNLGLLTPRVHVLCSKYLSLEVWALVRARRCFRGTLGTLKRVESRYIRI